MNWFKKLFCKHDKWETIYQKSGRFFQKGISGNRKYKKCLKCGKEVDL